MAIAMSHMTAYMFSEVARWRASRGVAGPQIGVLYVRSCINAFRAVPKPSTLTHSSVVPGNIYLEFAKTKGYFVEGYLFGCVLVSYSCDTYTASSK